MGTPRKDLSPTPAQEAGLRRFLDLLLEKNRSLNLTSVRDPDAAWPRHILDSLSLLPFLEGRRRLLDLGSGGGLPGIPLAIVRPGLEVALLEATGKKARFLEEAASSLELANVRVIHARAETAGRDPAWRGRFDTATARALGSLSTVIELALPFLEDQGRLLAMKGARVEEELAAAEQACRLVGGRMAGRRVIDPEAGSCIVEVRKIAPTPPLYPRRPGLPARRPLGAEG